VPAQEAAMPLMYVPFIMYASWMDFMTRGFVVPRDRTNGPSDEEQQTKDSRTAA
jgi:hypothetical protein